MATIELALREGEHATVPTKYRGQYVAVHRELARGTREIDPKGRWQITHVPTGYALWKFSKSSLNQVRAYARAMDAMPVLNFTDPKTVDLRAIRDSIVAILSD